MRRTRLALAAVLTGAGIFAASGGVSKPSNACAERSATAGAQLPAAITVTAGRVLGTINYQIGCNGHIRRVNAQNPFEFPQDAALEGNGDGVWFAVRHHHLIIGRGPKALWRSHEEFPSRTRGPIGLGGLTVGDRALAYAYHDTLYLAPVTGAEQPIARGESPIGFTTGGVYTYRWKRALILRRNTGTVLKTIARWPFDADFRAVDGNLYFIVDDTLMRARGLRVRRLVQLRRLGLSTDTWLQALGPLVELQDNDRLVMVRPNGSVYASTPLPRSHGQADTISSSVAFAPRDTAVAFTAATGLADDPNSGRSTPGSETIYVLRRGARAATPVHRERVEFPPCVGEGATLQWQASWILYNGADDHAAAFDTAFPEHAIELGRLIRRLPGTRDGFTAYWSDQPPTLW